MNNRIVDHEMKISRIVVLMSLAYFLVLAPLAIQAQVTAPVAAEPAPAHTADGHRNIQGFWEAKIGGTYDLADPRRGGGRLEELLNEKKGIIRAKKPSRIIDPPDGKVPYQAWAAAKQKDIAAHVDEVTEQKYVDPQARCLPDGVPRNIFWTPFQIIQSPGYVFIIYEENHTYRIIPLDGHPHIPANIKLWMGDSRGHWEGNTLVVDVTNINSKSRLDNVGDFASDAVHVVERFTFVDAKTINYEATIDDPSVYTQPWKIAAVMVHAHQNEKNYEYWEETCHEGERDVDQILVSNDATKDDHARK